MASWLPSSIQKRLLRYALLKTGFFRTQELDLNNLDITFGKQNNIELRDLDLHIGKLSELLQLPPELRLETARVIRLKLSIPADLYYGSIVAEVHGVDCSLSLASEDEDASSPSPRTHRMEESGTPSHRKTHRRIGRSPPFVSSGASGDDVRVPTTQDLARSFLMEEPRSEIHELEERYTSRRHMVASSMSEISDDGITGTGTTPGLPGFLADFLQGIVDRFQVKVFDVKARLSVPTLFDQSTSPSSWSAPRTIGLMLQIQSVDVGSLSQRSTEAPSSCRQHRGPSRQISVHGINVFISGLRSNEEVTSSPPNHRESPLQLSSGTSRSTAGAKPIDTANTTSSTGGLRETQSSLLVGPDVNPVEQRHVVDPLEIQAGEDNLAWNYRRSESGNTASDVWAELNPDTDLATSIFADNHLSGTASLTSTSRSDSSRVRPQLRFATHGTDDAEHYQAATGRSEQDLLELGSITNASDRYKDAAERDSTLQSQRSFPKSPLQGSVSAASSSTSASESMYMSAYNTISGHSMVSDSRDVSPKLDYKNNDGDTERSSYKVAPSPTQMQDSETLSKDLSSSSRSTIEPEPTLGRQASAPTSPSPVALLTADPLPTQIVHIDVVEIYLGSHSQDTDSEDILAESLRADPDERNTDDTKTSMPGTFSIYAEQSASVRFDDPNPRQGQARTATNRDTSTSNLHVSIRNIYFALNINLLADSFYLCKTIAAAAVLPTSKAALRTTDSKDTSSKSTFSLDMSSIHVNLLGPKSDYWKTVMGPSVDAGGNSHAVQTTLVSVDMSSVTVTSAVPNSSADWALALKDLQVAVGGDPVLQFSTRLQESKRSVMLQDAVIRLECSSRTAAATSQDIVQYSLDTQQVEFTATLDRIEETFSSYGGISSLLELSSTLNASDVSATPPRSPQKRGVRFDDSHTSRPGSTDIKVNARIGGLNAVISSRDLSCVLSTSAIKAVARPEYVAIAVDNVKISGPHRSTASARPINVLILNFRLEYLFHPKDADLERLLSLLTPSKNKYENDDDILIDTLLRQRRKGAVIRLAAADLRIVVDSWDCIENAQSFSDELAGLAAVTKYLPEDDRPGLLILARVAKAELQAPVNETFGFINVTLEDINVAQVGLPSLLAFAIGTVQSGGRGRPEIIHPLMLVSPGENLPMVMARLIGDEVEPTLRLKLFNTCAEYSIPTLIALTGLGTDVTPEQMIDLMASTVIDMASAANNPPSSSSISSSASKGVKKLHLDVLLHDCMVGLQPQGLESKAMFVMNNSKVSTIVPPKDDVKIAIELRKTSIYVRESPPQTAPTPGAVRIVVPERLDEQLATEGYVSTASIMSAYVDISIAEIRETTARVVEIDIRNELFLLESCADSTQTLVKTLGALAPPSPPSKEAKYRTEAMSMDEMVSSFTGDAFEKPASLPSTIFDVDMPAPPDEDDIMDASMSDSIYGGFDTFEDPEDDMFIEADRAPAEIAESLIDEDPFEIPDTPNAARLSNRDLVKELHSQLPLDSLASGPVDIEPFLLSEEQVDRLSGESTVLGAPYRWNTPKTQHPALVLPDRKPVPFRLRLRDFHIIWNLYDGYDWQRTRQTITQAVEEVELKAEQRRMRRQTAFDSEDEESVIGDCLFNSIYIGVPASREAQDLRRQINKGIDDLVSESESYATSGLSKPTNMSGATTQKGRRRPRRLRLDRSKAHKIAFELRGVFADVLVFPAGEQETQSSVDVRVRDLEIFDNLPTSTWRKFMTSWHKDSEEREMAKPMVHVELQNVRPVKDLSATEIVMSVTVTPVRLHVDQDALDFMTRFFEFKETSVPDLATDPADQPFLQRVEVHTVDLCLDYKPKRVDYAGIRSGRYTEFKNFFILDNAHIVLKHAILYGIRGFEPLNDTLNDIWMPDIKQNQLPGVISGLATISPLVNLGTGVAGIISVPIREYQKNGRIVRSIQKGAVHLARDTTSEIARFGARLAVGTQNLLTGAETMLSPAMDSAARRRSGASNAEGGWTDVEDEGREARLVSNYANQPIGVLQGLKSARRHLERDLLMARDAIIAVQGEIMDSDSASAAAQAVVRHAPTIMLRPVIGASRAVGQTLMGVGNQVDRANVKRVEDKYKQ